MPHDVLLQNYWAFLAIIPALLLVVAAFLRKIDPRFPTALRLLSLLLIVLALSDPISIRSNEQKELRALVDVSASVPTQGRQQFVKMLSRYLPEDRSLRLQLLGFGRKPLSDWKSVSSSAELSSAVEAMATQVDSGATDLEQALRVASEEDSSSSLLLVSDGIDTDGSLQRALPSLNRQGTRIFPLVGDASIFEDQKLKLQTVYAPLTAPAGSKVPVRTTLRNTSDEQQRATLEIWLDQKRLESRTVLLQPGMEQLYVTDSEQLEGGLHRLRAVLKQGATESETLHRWISVKEKSKLLLLSGTEDDRRVLPKLIRSTGFALEDIVADGSATIPLDLKSYRTIVMNNIARRQLPTGFLERLKLFVNNGGGLLLIGGDRSYGLGEYIDTPLEELSPVSFIPPQTKKRRLNSAVVLVLDKSRSMVFQNKILAAKRAAISAISTLKDDDFVSVIGFDSAPFIIIKLDRVPNVRPIAERRLQNLTAAGKTNLLPALAAARQSLRRAPASRKHIIVLSDGKFPLAGNDYVQEIARLREDGVTVSAVALGLEADLPFMRMLSQYGKGAFYHTLDPTRLPEIFLHDIKVSTGEKTMQENQDFIVGAGVDGIRSTTLRSFPVVRGFVETKEKKEAALELVTSREGKTFPILASWSVGKGNVVAFTSDANGRWSSEWVGWSQFGKFWNQLVDHVRPQDNQQADGDLDFDLRYTIQGDSIDLDLAVFDQALLHNLAPEITVKVQEPGGGQRALTFSEVAKGRFQARIDRGRPGDYRLEISYGTLSLPNLALTIPGDAFGESTGKGIALSALSDLAYKTGGAINPDPASIDVVAQHTEKTDHLFPPLALLAALLILAEAFMREWGGFALRKNRIVLQAQHKTVKQRKVA